MSTVIVVRDTTATLADALAEAVTQLAVQHRNDDALLTAWQCVRAALDQSALTNRQRELVLLDLIELRRSQIAEMMHVTPATLTTYWNHRVSWRHLSSTSHQHRPCVGTLTATRHQGGRA